MPFSLQDSTKLLFFSAQSPLAAAKRSWDGDISTGHSKAACVLLALQVEAVTGRAWLALGDLLRVRQVPSSLWLSGTGAVGTLGSSYRALMLWCASCKQGRL